MNHDEYGTKPVKLNNINKATHAEEMAIDKFYLKKAKKIINVSLIVIRITPSSTPVKYELRNSKPCIVCMHKVSHTEQFGYRINNIYFSDDNGNILRYKLRDIIKEEAHISKFYRLTGATIPGYAIND